MRFLFILPFVFSALLAEGFTAGIQGGTTGFGPAVSFRMSENTAFRMGAFFMSLEREEKVDTIKYDLDISLSWMPVLIDWNPSGSIFRISGGLFFNGSSADASYIPDFSVEIGGHTYTPDDVGEVTGKIKMQPVSPYLGIGLGKPIGATTGVRFLLDAGVAFTGINVNLNHQGGDLPAGLEEQLLNDLEMEADSLQDALEDFSLYPVLSAGLYYTW